MPYSVSRLRGCTDEPIFEARIDGLNETGIDGPDETRIDEATRERLLSTLSGFGDVERPLPDRPLVRLDEPGYVLTGNLETGRLRLRCTAAAESDPDGLRSQLEARLRDAFDA